MNIISHRKTYFLISGALVIASIVVIALFGLNYGIDFTGGSLLQIKTADTVTTDTGQIQALLTTGDKKLLESVLVQPTGERGYILRFRAVSEDEHQAILGKLRGELAPKDESSSSRPSPLGKLGAGPRPSPKGEGVIEATTKEGKPVEVKFEPAPGVVAESGEISIGGQDIVTEESFESIGPTIGSELKRRSVYALAAVLVAIILYIAWAFRKVSEPVTSWKYGVVAVIALLHDVIIPTGIFAVLGRFFGVEIDILFVTALLTILGFSVHDTIVVFDRTRENLAHRGRWNPLLSKEGVGLPAEAAAKAGGFEYIVNASVNQTMRRSINTSATAFLALLAIYLFGGESVKYFVLALMIGIIIGTYSSIFIASPLLVVWERWSRRK